MTKENKKDYIGSVKIKHKWLWILLLVVAAIGMAGFYCVNLYLNALNITEIGENFISVYLKDIKITLLFYFAAFILSMLLFSITSVIIKRNLLKWEETAVFLKTKTGFLSLNGVMALFAATTLNGDIAKLALTAFNPTWFVHADPIFGKNIGYYVFQRPFFIAISQWTFSLFLTLLIYILVIYFIFYVRNGAGGIKEVIKQKPLINHCIVVILFIYALIGITSRLAAENLLLMNSLTETSGGFTDITVWSKYYKLLPFIMCVIVVVTIVFLLNKRTKHSLYTMLAYPAILVLVAIYALGIQTFYVNPNKATIERPYIKHRIENTIRAYNLSNVNETTYILNGKINDQTITDNLGLIENIIVTDEENSLYMLNSFASNSKVHYYKDADLVPTINGNNISARYTSAKELFIDSSNKTLNEYNNRKMRYTHGYGMGVLPASLKESSVNMLPQITGQQFRIYFGETEKDFKEDYKITGTNIGEYDTTDLSEEKIFSYDGPAGINLNFTNRLLYAFRYGDPAILLSGNITDSSKILFNRNVVERARLAIPFLTYDEDPYLVETSTGSLVWILDAYTATNNFPYAVKLYDLDKDFGTNYVRNSVKVTVDAYTGKVSAYIIDWDDPIIRTLSSIYPEVFTTGSLPAEIKSHLKYPQKLFEMQSSIFKTYHDTNPSTFYTNDSAWEYAMTKSGENSSVKSLTPYYQILDSDGKKELVLIAPFTPAGESDNLTALLTVSSDINNYGDLTLYTFPRRSRVFGIMQTENRIEANEAISKEIEMLSAEGTVVYGPMKALPIMDTICYIKPIYVKSDSLHLKKVVLACGENAVIDSNLPAAFRRLAALNPKTDYNYFMPEPPEETEEFISEEYNDLILTALNKYSEAKQFSSEGDWVNYGKTMEEFENLLDEIKYNIEYPVEQ